MLYLLHIFQDMFKNGNTVQLVSRSSSRTVQIVMSSAGVLVLDAMGPLDPNASNCEFLHPNTSTLNSKFVKFQITICHHQFQINWGLL